VPIYVKKNNDLEQAEPVSRECPHCSAHAELLPVAIPSFDELMKSRPRHVAIGFRCAACNEPRFVRAAVCGFEPDRIELSSNLVEVERSKERFPFGYLPAGVETLFREALQCYSADCHNAFASMCRRSVHASLKNVRMHNHPHLYDLFRDVVQLCEIDDSMAQILESVLFDPGTAEPEIAAEQSAVLIEIIKDMLYQCYVRPAKLKAAMKMRRYFAEEGAQKVTSLDQHRANSA
jgi:hypothetical protein